VAWPPPAGTQAIPSHRGYDYLGDLLASHGFIVVSISANGINARNNRAADRGMFARAVLMDFHLNLWNTYNTRGGDPFGNRFVGRVDLSRVGTMGHSRGGEGAVRHYLYNAQQRRPFVIRAVLPLAPTNFHRFIINGTALGVLLPYCDGDLEDLQGVHFYDDTRYNQARDPGPKHTFLALGANHNFFNTVWSPSAGLETSIDEWYQFFDNQGVLRTNLARVNDPAFGTRAGSLKLNEARQRAVGITYMAAFFRAYVKGEAAFLPLLRGDALPPPSAQGARVYSSYHAPDQAAHRRDINRLLTAANLSRNTLGGAAGALNLSPFRLAGGEPPQPRHVLNWPNPDAATPVEPHTTVSGFAPNKRGLSQLVTGWDSNRASFSNDLPGAAGNIDRFTHLQFRAGVLFTDRRNRAGEPQNFSVTLTDAGGRNSSTSAGFWSPALFFPPGDSDVVPKLFLNTVRIPVWAFPGIRLDQVRRVRIEFNGPQQGAILLTDLALADQGPRIRGKLNAPNRLNHGRVRRGQAASQRLLIRNTNQNEQLALRINPPKPAQQYSLVFNGRPVAGSVFGVLQPGERVRVDVVFRPRKRGNIPGRVVIRSSDQLKKTVRLAGQGM
jgi:hypothetical protein